MAYQMDWYWTLLAGIGFGAFEEWRDSGAGHAMGLTDGGDFHRKTSFHGFGKNGCR